MNLLTLSVDHLIVNLLAILVCIGVIISCICRVNVTHALPWRMELIQLALAAFAFWAAVELRELVLGALLTTHDLAAGLGVMAYLLASSKGWRGPSVGLELEDGPRKATTAPLHSATASKFPPPPPGWGKFIEEERRAARHH